MTNIKIKDKDIATLSFISTTRGSEFTRSSFPHFASQMCGNLYTRFCDKSVQIFFLREFSHDKHVPWHCYKYWLIDLPQIGIQTYSQTNIHINIQTQILTSFTSLEWGASWQASTPGQKSFSLVIFSIPFQLLISVNIEQISVRFFAQNQKWLSNYSEIFVRIVSIHQVDESFGPAVSQQPLWIKSIVTLISMRV